MDSITQAALGATIAGAIAGKRCNGKVLLAGAALGTLPDLDVFINYGDDISNTVKHRGFSHSLLILLPFSLMLSWLIDKFRPIPKWSFGRLWLLVAAGLITHPLLDYFTSYGTQLLWPITGYYSLSSMFIIDPLYTLPLLLAVGFGLARGHRPTAMYIAALVISTLYLGWSLAAKQMVEERARDSLQALNLPQDKVFITPTPFNTLLWRIVVLDDERYWEGMASLLDDRPEVRFVPQSRSHWPMGETPATLNAFRAFTHDFVTYRIDGNRLIVADLRLGMPGNLAFQFQFAEKDDNHQWQPQTPIKLDNIALKGNISRLFDRMLGDQGIDPLMGNCALCTSLDDRAPKPGLASTRKTGG